jgi:hypothetical protein
LVARAQTPTTRAVAGEVERRHAASVSRAIRREQERERLVPLLDQAAPVIADLTAQHQDRHGHDLACCWLAPRLARRLAIRVADAWAVVHLRQREPPPVTGPRPGPVMAKDP